MTDGELLANYLADGSPAAFAQLVERHAPMVYGACLRVTGDRSMAEAAAQAAFLMLKRQAPRLAGRRVLCGWLHAAAYRAACAALEGAGGGEILIETRELAAVD